MWLAAECIAAGGGCGWKNQRMTPIIHTDEDASPGSNRFRIPWTQRTVPLVIRTLRYPDEEAAGFAWEELEKHLNDGSVTCTTMHENFNSLADEYEALWRKVKGDWPEK
jgi:hypothetical protein